MKKTFPVSFEFIYQLFSLILIIIIVHAVYVAVIRPQADAILARQAAMLDEDQSQVTERSVFVLIKDYEQETCFILMLWALAIMAYKSIVTIRHRALLQKDLIPLAEAVRILPEDTRSLSRQIQALPPQQREALLPGPCWRHCTGSVPPEIYRMPPTPPTPIVPRKPKGWNPISP